MVRKYSFTPADRYRDAVEASGLIAPRDRIVVGVSGGADSCFLLHALLAYRKRWELSLAVAHMNHGLRGAESDREETFVADLCRRWALPFRVERWRKKKDGSVSEESARDARYAFFEKVCRETESGKLALAHTRDDDVETILFRLFRGSGLSGLRGIPAVRPLGLYQIIRPLKEMDRETIRETLKREGIEWCEDGSNQDLRMTRNRIRHQLLPLLERSFNPNIRKILTQLGKNVAEDYAYLNHQGLAAYEKILFKEGKERIVLRRRPFQTFERALQKQVFREALRRLGTDMDRIGYAEWESVRSLFGRKSFRVTLPGPLHFHGTPTKVVFTRKI